MKEEFDDFDEMFEQSIQYQVLNPYEDKNIKIIEKARYNLDFNEWLRIKKGFAVGDKGYCTRSNWMEYLREHRELEVIADKKYKAEILKDKIDSGLIKKNDLKLTLKQIALKYIYEDRTISRQNGNEIAKEYGQESGEGLYHHFIYFTIKANRTGNPDKTSRALKSKIKLFESVIEILPNIKKQRALDELNVLKLIFKDEYCKIL